MRKVEIATTEWERHLISKVTNILNVAMASGHNEVMTYLLEESRFVNKWVVLESLREILEEDYGRQSVEGV